MTRLVSGICGLLHFRKQLYVLKKENFSFKSEAILYLSVQFVVAIFVNLEL